MKPTPKELLELYQTATESLEEMFRKYELTIAEQAEKIKEQETQIRMLKNQNNAIRKTLIAKKATL